MRGVGAAASAAAPAASFEYQGGGVSPCVVVAFEGLTCVSTIGQNVGAGAGTRAGERAEIGGDEVEVEGCWACGEVVAEIKVVLQDV